MRYRSNGLISLAAVAILAAATGAGCGGGSSPQVVGGPGNKPIPFEDLTLQNLFSHAPSGQEYVEGTGSGRPPEDEKNMDARRKAARDAAIIEAEKQLIAKMEKLVERNKIRSILKKAQVAKVEYTYDDGCVVTLQIPKEDVVGNSPMQDDTQSSQ